MNVEAGSSRPTDVQLTSRSAFRGTVKAARTPRSAASASARAAVRFQTVTSAPALRSDQAHARALPPAPSSTAVCPVSSLVPSARSSPGASVLSPWMVPSSRKLSVFTAPISRAASVSSSLSRSAASLCGIVTLAPTNPAAGRPRTVSSKSSGGTGSS